MGVDWACVLPYRVYNARPDVGRGGPRYRPGTFRPAGTERGVTTMFLRHLLTGLALAALLLAAGCGTMKHCCGPTGTVSSAPPCCGAGPGGPPPGGFVQP